MRSPAYVTQGYSNSEVYVYPACTIPLARQQHMWWVESEYSLPIDAVLSERVYCRVGRRDELEVCPIEARRFFQMDVWYNLSPKEAKILC